MKYLKTYENIFNRLIGKKPSLSKEIIQDIRDICLELQDNGFRVFTNQLGFNRLGNREGFYPNIEIFKTRTSAHLSSSTITFEYKDIEEVVERLKDYMKQHRCIIKVDKIYRNVSKHSKKLIQVKLIFINLF